MVVGRYTSHVHALVQRVPQKLLLEQFTRMRRLCSIPCFLLSFTNLFLGLSAAGPAID